MMKSERAKWILVFGLAAGLAACGGRIDDKGKSNKFNPDDIVSNNDQNSTSNNATNNNSNNVDPAACGNGTLEAGELCDPAIAAGSPGACPDSCNAPACSTAMLSGSAEQCTAQCVIEPVACGSGDGCCPAGCDAGTDDDCTNVCGDGQVDEPELCDGNCPTSCSDGDACTTDTLQGSADACSAACTFDPIISCSSGDGCCPDGCTSANDNDCEPTSSCGNGTIDSGETCDGNCPSSCIDSDACTTDALVGSAAMCTAQCSYTDITSCQSGDGCCPTGCTYATDRDCTCTPKTCNDIAAGQCGAFDDGCGSTIQCDTCGPGKTCSGSSCVYEDYVGDPCTDYPQCGDSNEAACITASTWPNGYCTLVCNSITCPASSHCVNFDGTNELCMLNCTSDANCSAGYECLDFDGDGSRECAVPPSAGDGQFGAPCSSDNDCDADLSCITESSDGNGGTTTYPGGTCTRPCAPIIDPCTDTTSCSLDLYCMPNCTSDLDCRDDYFCSANFSFDGISLMCQPS